MSGLSQRKVAASLGLQETSCISRWEKGEYLPGIEYSVDCVCMDGETIACIPRQRVETSMGVSVESIVEKNDEIIDISKKIIKALNLSYNVNIQFKYSVDGKPKLLEINPRVSGSLISNFGAGVNMLELSLKLAYGLPLPSIDIKWGTKMMRYWSQLYVYDQNIYKNR